MLKVTIDGIQVEVKKGTSILQAAGKAGVHIPTFCNHDLLDPIGACRICLVEIEGGPPRLFASCVTPAADNMVVKTRSEKIDKGRRANVELLLVHHPLDCPVCPASGKCDLQNLTMEFGIQSGRFVLPRKEEAPDQSNPIIEQNDNRCIVCGKCIRVCDEVQGEEAISFVKRGFDTYVGTPYGNELKCDFCGHCVTICPVGARNSRFLMKGRPWNVKTEPSLCSFCGTGCTLSYDVRERENRVVNAEAAPGRGVNGFLQCSKGWLGFQYIHSEDRPLKPLVRLGENFAPASWDVALEEVAKNLKGVIEQYGPQAVAGIGSERMTNEDNYFFQKFFRSVLGSNKVDNLLNMKNKAMGEEFPDTLGKDLVIVPLDRLEKVGLIFLLGADASEESPVVGNMIRRAVTKRNVKLITANCRNIKLSQIAAHSLIHGAETETVLINGIINEILSRNLISRNDAATRVENFQELERAVSGCTPAYVEKVTGVGSQDLSQAAEAVASADGAIFLCGRQVTENARNRSALEALKNLLFLTGNCGTGAKGGIAFFREYCNSQGVNDMGVTPGRLPGYQSARVREVREKFEKEWGAPLPEPDGETGDIIEQALRGKIKALYIMGEDPVMRYPDGKKVRRALKKVEFIICQDTVLTESASYADIFLPGASFAEKSGSFTNMEGRVQRLTRLINPMGEALPDIKILHRIGERMGARLKLPAPEEVMAEIVRLAPLYGFIHEEGRKGYGELVRYTRAGEKARTRAEIVSFVPREPASGDYPFTLVTENILYQLGPNSRKSQALNAMVSESFVEINPRDLRKLGIKEGDRLLIESPHGKLTLPARVSVRSPQGVAFIPINFESSPVNTLTSANGGLTRVRLSKSGG